MELSPYLTVLGIIPSHGAASLCIKLYRLSLCSDLVPPSSPTRTISASTQVQGGDFNLYENMRCHGVPLVTISRGRVVYENGVFMCAEGTGKFCPLRSFPDIVYKKLVQREKVRQGRKEDVGHEVKAPVGGHLCFPPLPLMLYVIFESM